MDEIELLVKDRIMIRFNMQRVSVKKLSCLILEGVLVPLLDKIILILKRRYIMMVSSHPVPITDTIDFIKLKS